MRPLLWARSPTYLSGAPPPPPPPPPPLGAAGFPDSAKYGEGGSQQVLSELAFVQVGSQAWSVPERSMNIDLGSIAKRLLVKKQGSEMLRVH